MKSPFEKESTALLAFDTDLTSGGVRKAMADIGAKSRDLWMVDVEHIHIIKGFNPRIHDEAYEAHTEEIKDSMMLGGYKLSKPLEGFIGADNKIYLTDGHTRLEAYKRAIKEGLEKTPVPMVPREKGTSMEDLTVDLVRSNNGKRLTSYETAIICKRLSAKYHHTAKEISELLGFSDKYVGQLLDLAGAPAEVREMVQSGQVTASLAIEALAKHKDGATAMLQAALGKAAGQGQKKVTKKHTISADELRLKREKKLCHRLFAAVELLMADQRVINVIDKEVYKELDTLIFERDKAGK